MRTLDEMAAVGRAKLENKERQEAMKAAWEAAKDRMAEGYEACPFGPVRKATFKAALEKAIYRVPDPEKWERVWKEKMSV